jgi:hypothetical protein
MPLYPGARIKRADVAAHEDSRRDRNSSYWKAVRGAVPDLSEEEARHVSHLTVLEPQSEEQIPSVLDEKLDKFVKSSLFRAAPKDQLKRNLLLYGPPGSGKTHAVQTIAARLNLKMIILKYSDIHNMFVGESGKVLSASVRLAWSLQPAILFIDEGENLLGSRTTGSAESHDAHVTSELMAVMHGGVNAQPGLMIICCTNLLHRIDSAALDRFQMILEAPYPDVVMREVVWTNILKDAGITLTPAEFEQVQSYPLPSLREIGRVVMAWEELETEDTSKMLRIAEDMSAEPESDAELEEFFVDQRRWRGFASKYMRDLLPPGWPDSSDRIHIAIPSHMGSEGQWEACLAWGAAQVLAVVGENTDPFKLCLDEQSRGCWCLRRTDQEDIHVVLNLNNTVNIRGQGDEGTMQVLQQQITSLQQQITSLTKLVTGRGATTEKKDKDNDGGEDVAAEEERVTKDESRPEEEEEKKETTTTKDRHSADLLVSEENAKPNGLRRGEEKDEVVSGDDGDDEDGEDDSSAATDDDEEVGSDNGNVDDQEVVWKKNNKKGKSKVQCVCQNEDATNIGFEKARKMFKGHSQPRKKAKDWLNKLKLEATASAIHTENGTVYLLCRCRPGNPCLWSKPAQIGT